MSCSLARRGQLRPIGGVDCPVGQADQTPRGPPRGSPASLPNDRLIPSGRGQRQADEVGPPTAPAARPGSRPAARDAAGRGRAEPERQIVTSRSSILAATDHEADRQARRREQQAGRRGPRPLPASASAWANRSDQGEPEASARSQASARWRPRARPAAGPRPRSGRRRGSRACAASAGSYRSGAAYSPLTTRVGIAQRPQEHGRRRGEQVIGAAAGVEQEIGDDVGAVGRSRRQRSWA